MIEASAQYTERTRIGFSSAIEFGIVASLWALSIFIVNPVGEFPIIDDGLYESLVNHLLTTGEFQNPEPASTTLLTNIIWGASFCLAKGASFTALRISTLFASFLGLFGIHALARELGVSLAVRLLIILTVSFSPAYHALSYSFMTDVPFATLVTWSSVFFLRSVKYDSMPYFIAATLLTVVSTLSRQVALAIPVSFGLALLLEPGAGWKRAWRALIPLFIAAAVLSEYYHVLANTHRLPVTYNFFSNVMMSTLTHARALLTIPFINAYITLIYLGLFLLPLLVGIGGGLFQARGKGFWVIFSLGLATTAAGAVIRMKVGLPDVLPLPESHVIVNSGIGLLWLRGADYMPALPNGFWYVITVLAIVGSTLFLAQISLISVELTRSAKEQSSGWHVRFGVLFIMLSGMILLCPYLFTGASDRYLTASLPLLAVGMAGTLRWCYKPAGEASRVAKIGSTILIAGVTAFSIVGTRDYMAWHRVAAQASEHLTQNSHVTPDKIDGGEEFNAFYPAYQGREDQIDFSGLAENPTGYVFTAEIDRQRKAVVKLAWRPPDVPYIVSFGPVPDYTIIQEYSYHNWMPPHLQKILVLQRTTP